MATLMSPAFASTDSDQTNAIAPVTKGAATLVPPEGIALLPVPRLVTPSPGALAAGRWHLGESRAQIYEASAGINTFDDSGREFLWPCTWDQLICIWRLGKNWTHEQG